jgi:hypothetical protein
VIKRAPEAIVPPAQAGRPRNPGSIVTAVDPAGQPVTTGGGMGGNRSDMIVP